MSQEPAEPPSRSATASRREREIVVQNPCEEQEGPVDFESGWLEALVTSLAPDAQSFVLRFVSDDEMIQLQKDYRRREGTTDVLSFPGDPEDDEPGERHLGDVVISLPQARRQATERGHDERRELRTLALHGVLHCMGYDHETDDGAMESLEDELREQWLEREVGHYVD